MTNRAISASFAVADETLAQRAKNGDDEALADLIERYTPLVCMRARAYARGVMDVDDVYQEGMIALLKAVRNYREDTAGSFRTFAAVCVNNKMLSAVTAHMRDKNAPMRSYLSLSGREIPEDLLAAVSPETDRSRPHHPANRRRVKWRCHKIALPPSTPRQARFDAPGCATASAPKSAGFRYAGAR